MQNNYTLHKPTTIPVTQLSLNRISQKGKWMQVMEQTLRRVHDKEIFQWEVLSKKPAVTVLPITPAKELILIDQFRYPIMNWELECPAETMDQEGDTSEGAVVRALSEEIGYRCERIQRVATYASSGGTTDELSYGFLAHDCTPLEGGHHRSEDEIIRVNHVPLSHIEHFLDTRIRDGQILNPKMDGLIGRYLRNIYSSS